MTRNLKFGTAINGTNNPGIMLHDTDPPKLFCYCSEANAKIIMAALKPKETKSIEQRELEFKNKVWNFIDSYSDNTLIEFINYWTERGENDRKLRFEKEKAFDISKRLARWKAREKNDSPKNDKKVIGRQDESQVKNNLTNWNFNG